MIRFGRWIRAAEGIMAGKEIAVKKYVVRLSSEERQQLETEIRRGKGPARRLLKARILLQDYRRLGHQRIHGLPRA